MGGMEWDTREKRDGGAKEIMLHPNPYMTLSRHAITTLRCIKRRPPIPSP